MWITTDNAIKKRRAEQEIVEGMLKIKKTLRIPVKTHNMSEEKLDIILTMMRDMKDVEKYKRWSLTSKNRPKRV